ncbi:hypothetical protein [Caudoviricetes sp.]|nr:hypothetical protein [Caudoviricetes sp.]
MDIVKVKLAFAKVRKAVVAAVAAGLVVVLRRAGVEIDNDAVAVLVDAVIVSGLVWAVPNAKPLVEDGK